MGYVARFGFFSCVSHVLHCCEIYRTKENEILSLENTYSSKKQKARHGAWLCLRECRLLVQATNIF